MYRALFVSLLLSLSAYSFVKKNFGKPLIKGEVSDAQLPEVSGLVRSVVNEGFLWAHNDSGHRPELFLLDSTGALVKKFHVSGAGNLDWEDIAIHQEDNGNSSIYIGDIGDNFGFLPFRTIYKLKEPAITDEPEITAFEQMIYTYEDGPRDAETLLVDPENGEVVVISKREKEVSVYSGAFRHFENESDTVTLSKLGKLKLTQIVGGDITPDGGGLILKNYEQVFYWELSEGLKTLFTQSPETIVSYIREPQGEAICWDSSGKGFYTLSEYAKLGKSILYYYPSLEE